MAKSIKKQAPADVPQQDTIKENKKIIRLRKKKQFPVVAIGGSAGSYDALENFFKHMPKDSGIAYVVVVHLDPTRKGLLPELLGQTTGMPVHEISDGMEIEPDNVYVIPSNRELSVHAGKLLLLEPSKPRGLRMPIDYFFQSLAHDMGERVVGVVLSGMGADGELGLKVIKENMGMIIAQDPDTAEYDSMPSASIQTGMVDYILPPEEMPEQIISYLSHPVIIHDGRQNIKIASSHNALQKIFMLLRSHTGHDFSMYKQSTIIRRVERRIAFHQLADIIEYVHYLRENPLEIETLFKELLIGVTKFFRDSQAFEKLQRELFSILRKKTKGENIRVWIAGCSTGEEAYSIAILLLECMDLLPNKNAINIQIFATDLDLEAIEHARAGIYLSNLVGDVSPERVERFFVKKDELHYQINKEVRDLIVFAQHNIIKDAPFTKLDLLCCRNLLIYLTSELQKKIIPVFHYSLLPAGLLFLGPSESIGTFTDLFQPAETKWKIFKRKESDSTYTRMIDFPFTVSRMNSIGSQQQEPGKQLRKTVTLAESFQKVLLENYSPPALIVNDKGDILYINGRMGKFMELNTGQAVMNVHRMINEALKYELGNAIHEATKQHKQVKVDGLKINLQQNTHNINLIVTYLEEPIALQGLILIVFEDKGIILPQKKNKKSEVNSDAEQQISALEKELNYTRNQLQTTIEQMETSLEELKSTNEELQSTNEELQSTNEESITTKEEMQSLNEELMTLNIQYQNKAEELTEKNNDIKNLMDSTQIATIFLSSSFNVLRFTPAASHIFNLIQTDVGRPITDIVSRLQYIDLEKDIKETLDKLVPKEIQVRTTEGLWFILRIMPYRTLNNFISGIVLTFVDITKLKELEENLNLVQQYAETIIETVNESLVVLDRDFKVVATSRSFLQNFHPNLDNATGRTFFEMTNGLWDIHELRKMLDLTLNKGEEIVNKQMLNDFGKLGKRNLNLNIRPIYNSHKEPNMVLLAINEITS